jgi:hypothetical protein
MYTTTAASHLIIATVNNTFKALAFKSDLFHAVMNNEKRVTSRLSSDLLVNDVVYLQSDNTEDDTSLAYFRVTSRENKRIADVDYRAESFNSTEELLAVLNQIYYVNLKRIDKELTVNDTMTVITFERIDIIR